MSVGILLLLAAAAAFMVNRSRVYGRARMSPGKINADALLAPSSSAGRPTPPPTPTPTPAPTPAPTAPPAPTRTPMPMPAPPPPRPTEELASCDDFGRNAKEVGEICREIATARVVPAMLADASAQLVLIGYRLGGEQPEDLGAQRASRMLSFLADGSLRGSANLSRMGIADGGVSTDGALARFVFVPEGASLPEGMQIRFFRMAAMIPPPDKPPARPRIPRPRPTATGAEAGPTPVPKPTLKYQEDVEGEYPNRMETQVANTVSLRFVRKLVEELQPVDQSQSSGKRTEITQTARPVAGRDVTVPLERAMGEAYEPWIRATLRSETVAATAKTAEMADWRRLDGQMNLLWEWEIASRSPLPQQEVTAAIEIEWRLRTGGAGEAKRHLLWENVLSIAVDDTVIKKYQLQTATPVCSMAGAALLIAAALPRRRRREEEERSLQVAPEPSGMLPESAPAAAPPAATMPQAAPAAAPPPSSSRRGARRPPPPAYAEPAPQRIAVSAGPRGEAAAQLDTVECSVFAPPAAAVGATLMIQVFAHLHEQAAEAAQMAAEFDEEARRRAVRTLSSKVARGATLMFDLTIENWAIPEPVQTLVWNGRPESAQFVVDVPADCDPGNVACKLTVSENSVPLGHISFVLKVTAAPAEAAAQEPVPAGDDAKRYSYAFISYASPDRSEVLERVQMLETMGIRYFQDVLSLDPGDRWEKKLYENIDRCDLFLLFWSHAARESPWVMKEVEYALGRKKGDFDAPPEIKPVIIEGPPLVPPPESLKALHFNDRLLYFINAGKGKS
ncbi:MAG: toll/interleukin-1 receptor domain-containing protein [Blastocatellia bacterium]|nr:toll/interleukin-1 receptor domain-containing protein [Blastocatellia bacterium]